MHAPRVRFSLPELTGVVLVAAMALAQLTSRIAPVRGAIRMAVIGICIVAAADALSRRERARHELPDPLFIHRGRIPGVGVPRELIGRVSHSRRSSANKYSLPHAPLNQTFST
jgi:hypothetical protein